MTSSKHPSGLSKRQRDKIIKYMSDDKTLIAAVATTVTKKRKSPRARAIAKGDTKLISKIIINMFKRLPPDRLEQIRKYVCERHDYCHNKKDLQFIASVIQTITVCIEPHTGALCISVFALKFRVFDELCGCGSKSRLRLPHGHHQHEGPESPDNDSDKAADDAA